jgi:hypothetical protein
MTNKVTDNINPVSNAESTLQISERMSWSMAFLRSSVSGYTPVPAPATDLTL